jgi:hypothetical protein
MTASTDALPAASGQRQRVPEFFVVGHQKCGTSALYEMLRSHPQIYMPDVKETWYFSSELRSAGKRRRLAERPESFDEYLSLFDDAKPGQRVGENSPAYLMSSEAAKRIADARPDARIIAILREPASFLHSFHLQCLRNHVETEKSFAKAIALEADRREGRKIPPHSQRPHELLYSEHVRYVAQLQRYHAVFAREQVLVLIYEDFRRDNEATMRKVLSFLDVDETVALHAVEANPSYRVRSPQLHELLRSVYLGRGSAARKVKTAMTSVTSRRMRRSLLRLTLHGVVYGEPQREDERVMNELRSRCKAEVLALSQYLDRDLVSLWGYDRVE